MEKVSIFSADYWKSSLKNMTSLKKLVFAALICALNVVLNTLFIEVAPNLKIMFTFFVVAVGCAVYGPVTGMAVAAIADLLGYMLSPSGVYFPGYMFSRMLSALIYSLFLYRRKITIPRLFFAKFFVSLISNVLLGSLWSKMLLGKGGYITYLINSAVKNAILLPLEVIALGAFFAVLLPPFSQLGLLPTMTQEELKRLAIGSSSFLVFGLSCLLGGGFGLYYVSLKGGLALQILSIVLLVAGVALLIAGPLYRRHREAKETT